MKLIIQIPCYNEEQLLPKTLACLPREVEGFDLVEWLVIDDGSTDRTAEVAHAAGVDHVLRLAPNHGLARAFVAGIERALIEGADVVVNTDGDNQYRAGDIGLLVAPILAGRAEMVIGARPIAQIRHFSPTKKLLQHLGSWVVRVTSGVEVADAPSGFRALSHEACLRLNIFDSYTYTLESIIQAGRSGLTVESVPIRVNEETRPSRLIRSIGRYVFRSSISIIRSLVVYRPGHTFFYLSLVPLGLSLFLGLRWLVLFLNDSDRSHVPSLIVAGGLATMAALCWLFALLGEVNAINRRLLEDVQYRLRAARLGPASRASDAD